MRSFGLLLRPPLHEARALAPEDDRAGRGPSGRSRSPGRSRRAGERLRGDGGPCLCDSQDLRTRAALGGRARSRSSPRSRAAAALLLLRPVGMVSVRLAVVGPSSKRSDGCSGGHAKMQCRRGASADGPGSVSDTGVGVSTPPPSRAAPPRRARACARRRDSAITPERHTHAGSKTGPHVRRLHRRLGRRRRHGRLRAHAGRRPRRDARGGRPRGTRRRTRRCSPRRTPRRAAARRRKTRPFGEFDACDGGWEIDGEPYTRAPGTRFDWWRARMLGGRTNHWGRISLRFGPDDFRGKSLDGLGDDWPISYDDVTPYYDRVDDLIGIFGSKEGLRNDPDGNFQPPPKPRCYELLVKKASRQAEHHLHPVAALDHHASALPGRQACHYCGQCNRGCTVKANFSSPDVLIAPALATGRLTLLTNAMAREVTVGTRRAGDRRVVHRQDAPARTSTCARASSCSRRARCESARLLLNSQVVALPAGTRQLERRRRQVPHRHDRHRRRRLHPGDGGSRRRTTRTASAACTSTCRGGSTTRSSTSRAATTSRCGGGLRQPSYGFMGGIHRYPGGGGYGAKLKDDYRRYYGATIGFSGRGERSRTTTATARSIRPSWTSGGFRCCASTGSGPTTSTTRSKHMQETFRALIAEMGGDGVLTDADARAGLRHRGGRPHHPRAGRRAHGQRSRRHRCSTRTARRTTARTCSSPTAGRSSRRRTRIRRGRSSRSRGGRATTSREQRKAGAL